MIRRLEADKHTVRILRTTAHLVAALDAKRETGALQM
jgi:hypothetical protein